MKLKSKIIWIVSGYTIFLIILIIIAKINRSIHLKREIAASIKHRGYMDVRLPPDPYFHFKLYLVGLVLIVLPIILIMIFINYRNKKHQEL
jgi:pilus assembly protein TadC